MFNVKWGGVAAGAAFVLAALLSLVLGQTTLLVALLRAVIFGSLFFGLGTAAWTLINTFIPDLLSATTADTAHNPFSAGTTGSQVNITVDDTQAALPEQAYGAPDSSDVGDFNDLFMRKNTAGGDGEDIDQSPISGYTEEGETEGFAVDTGKLASATEGEFTSAFDDFGLDDEGGSGEEQEEGGFSMDFSAFVPSGLSGGDGEDGETDGASDADPFSFFGGGGSIDEPAPERRSSGNKPMKLEGDFNAKEIAAGLRTVLEKDKK